MAGARETETQSVQTDVAGAKNAMGGRVSLPCHCWIRVRLTIWVTLTQRSERVDLELYTAVYLEQGWSILGVGQVAPIEMWIAELVWTCCSCEQ